MQKHCVFFLFFFNQLALRTKRIKTLWICDPCARAFCEAERLRWGKALCRHSLPLFFAVWSPDSLARISLYNPSAVKVVVIGSGISRRQNPSRHRSSYVTSTLSCKESRQRGGGRLWFTFKAHINIVSWWEIKRGEQLPLRCVGKQTECDLSAGGTFKCKQAPSL